MLDGLTRSRVSGSQERIAEATRSTGRIHRRCRSVRSPRRPVSCRARAARATATARRRRAVLTRRRPAGLSILHSFLRVPCDSASSSATSVSHRSSTTHRLRRKPARRGRSRAITCPVPSAGSRQQRGQRHQHRGRPMAMIATSLLGAGRPRSSTALRQAHRHKLSECG